MRRRRRPPAWGDELLDFLERGPSWVPCHFWHRMVAAVVLLVVIAVVAGVVEAVRLLWGLAAALLAPG